MLNLFDFIISSVIITFFFSGFFKGAVRLMLANISFILSIVLSNILFPSAKNVVEEYIKVTMIANIVAGSVAYIISLIVCSLMFSQIKTLIKPLCGGLVDKTCGALLGLVNGALLSMALFVVAAAVLSKNHITEHENLYLLINSFDQDSYPKWLQGSNGFYIMDNILKSLAKAPFIADILQQINFDMIFSPDVTDKKIPTNESLDQQINNLLKHDESDKQ
jgi:uncharacterized membrane protein required for colicin V production